MLIRKATEEDIHDIILLLKSSLGESLLPKSEAYWRWKHIQNPFGPSPVLLAFEGNKLIGVRAFMCWKWVKNDQAYHAVRAVDTATHPDHQGKGVFKKLTLQLLESCKTDRYQFVFNTPNKSSMPGYLKMGWMESGKLPIHFSVKQPVRMLFHLLKPAAHIDQHVNAESVQHILSDKSFDQVLEKHRKRNSDKLITDFSVNYFRWRYQDVPVVKYYAASLGDRDSPDGFFFYRIKSSRAGNEFRITDCICADNNRLKDLRQVLKKKVKEHNAHYVTITGAHGSVLSGKIESRGIRIGPSVTIRNINTMDMSILRNFSAWEPSLGDLELF